jgi:hypothetical protein
MERLGDERLSHFLDACSYYIAHKHSLVKRVPVSVEW